ncbi:hypothetical protein ACVIHH_003066 [Bradyrhizobium sp. USDA 4518]
MDVRPDRLKNHERVRCSPKPKTVKIPVINADELADALRAYFEATYPFAYRAQDIEARDGDTHISFYGNRTDDGRRFTLEATIYGKAARSWQSKLFNMRFEVHVYEDPGDLLELAKLGVKKQMEIRAQRARHLLIEPMADRSISISRILRWDKGRPVLES